MSKECVTHHKACDCREKMMIGLLVQAENALIEIVQKTELSSPYSTYLYVQKTITEINSFLEQEAKDDQ